jgi:hypothetical protein
MVHVYFRIKDNTLEEGVVEAGNNIVAESIPNKNLAMIILQALLSDSYTNGNPINYTIEDYTDVEDYDPDERI